MAGIQQIINSQPQLDQNNAADVMFRTRCAIPGIIQSYDATQNTVEVQPAIRERMVMEDGSVQYINLPLLVNVPVSFPSSSSSSITFPINPGDECLVVFSDLAIDNFWSYGSVQNPIEVRRHDLSDGIAFPCSLSLPISQGASGALKLACGSGYITVNSSSVKAAIGNALSQLTATGARLSFGDNYVVANSNGVAIKAGDASISALTSNLLRIFAKSRIEITTSNALVQVSDTGVRVSFGDNYVVANEKGVAIKANDASITALASGVLNISTKGKLTINSSDDITFVAGSNSFTGTQIYNKLQE